MPTYQRTPYDCVALRRTVLVTSHIKWVSCIGQDEPEPVEIYRRCEQTTSCKFRANCPLRADAGFPSQGPESQ